jgi:hypothetical protein
VKVVNAIVSRQQLNRAIAAYEQIVYRGHAHGMKVYGATITPYVGFE